MRGRENSSTRCNQKDRAGMSRRKGRNEAEKKIKEEKEGHKKRRKRRRNGRQKA